MKHIIFQGSERMVVDKTHGDFFRELSYEEHGDFIKWAHEQPKGVVVKSIWHPVIQDELLSSGHGIEKE